MAEIVQQLARRDTSAVVSTLLGSRQQASVRRVWAGLAADSGDTGAELLLLLLETLTFDTIRRAPEDAEEAAVRVVAALATFLECRKLEAAVRARFTEVFTKLVLALSVAEDGAGSRDLALWSLAALRNMFSSLGSVVVAR